MAGELRVAHFAAIGASQVAQVAAVFEARYPTRRVVTMPQPTHLSKS
ncbi:hypothetical protein [Pseudonocardia acaciae]|nr:hypothetical protein [Pseudonocardia acaciae]